MSTLPLSGVTLDFEALVSSIAPALAPDLRWVSFEAKGNVCTRFTLRVPAAIAKNYRVGQPVTIEVKS